MTPNRARRPSGAAEWCAAGVRYGPRNAGEPPRWERCIDHRGDAVDGFVAQHFASDDRRVLLVGGAGFDPRTLTVAQLLTRTLDNRLEGLFIRERRPSPDRMLLAQADGHATELQRLVPASRVVDIDVFESDGAVGLGRRIVDLLRDLDIGSYTDIVIDFSALSIGSSFPLTRLLLERLEAADADASATGIGETPRTSDGRINLHAMVTARTTTDDQIVPSPSAVVGPVHGFQGRFGLDETARAAKLWIPQLPFDQRSILGRLYDYLQPHDVVPVLPFPAHDPRRSDRLIEHYATELENRWTVDARSLVYADETSPLDFYRTVLRMDDGRHPVFASTGGSLLILSPIGSKVLALGAMMAAAERDLPVMYVEALGYSANVSDGDQTCYSSADIVHVWLFGEAYPRVAASSTDTTGAVG